jgi:hypothetical protein
MRIGEILTLRWKRFDFQLGTIEVAESCSNGRLGTPKTYGWGQDQIAVGNFNLGASLSFAPERDLDFFIRSYAIPNSKCRFWCRL